MNNIFHAFGIVAIHIAIFLHLITPSVQSSAAAPIVGTIVIPSVLVTKTVLVAPAKTAAVVASPIPAAPVVLPSGAILDGTSTILNQAAIDAQNLQNEADSVAAQNVLRLQQAQAAASSSALKLANQAAVAKASQLADLNAQMQTLVDQAKSDTDGVNGIQKAMLANPAYTTYDKMIWDKQREAFNADLATTQDAITSLQTQIDSLK